jgi:hypothetical protein
MPLPNGFSPWEHLQDQVQRQHNKLVRAYFSGQPDDDISTPKRSLKHACIIQESDTTAMVQMRMWLFEVTVGHASSLHPPIYGMPVYEMQSTWKFRPQIKMHFIESSEDVEQGYSPLTGEVSIRLMDEKSEDITRAKAERYATKIKQLFATPLFQWKKGWHKCLYLDLEHGYDFRLLVVSKAEGKRIIEQTLDIQGHSPQWNLLQYQENESPASAYPANPGTWRLYGKTRKKPRKRGRGTVRFRYADLHIWGLQNALTLVDATHRKKRAILTV